MKKILIIVFFTLLVRPAISQTWVSVTDNPVVNFDMPDAPAFVDSVHTRLYYYRPDSLLGLTVHIITEAAIDDQTGLFQMALDEQAGDTLRAMIQLLTSLSGHELISIEDKNYHDIPGVEVGISIPNPDYPEYDCLVFMRMFYRGQMFVTFSAASYVTDIDRLNETKVQFFNSVEFKH